MSGCRRDRRRARSIVGKVIAALLTGADSGFDLRPFRPDRFAGTGIAWTNPFTLGEKSRAAVA
jgi:hypothetical protein